MAQGGFWYETLKLTQSIQEYLYENSKRITFNLFIKSNGKLNITVMEGKASKQDKSFEVVSGKTLTEMRQNAGIKDGAEWQITNRFDKRHVKPTLVEGESVYCFARAVKADETYYLAVVKTASGFRAVMHHKSKRNEYGVETRSCKTLPYCCY